MRRLFRPAVATVLCALAAGCGEVRQPTVDSVDHPDAVPVDFAATASDLAVVKRLEGNEYLWGSVRDIALAPDGGVAVLDGQSQIASVVDSAGVESVLTARGDGPGEIRSAISIDSHGSRLVIFEASGDVELFDISGDHLGLVRITGLNASESGFDARGNLTVVLGDAGDGLLMGRPAGLTSGGPFALEPYRSTGASAKTALILAWPDGTGQPPLIDSIPGPVPPDRSVYAVFENGRMRVGFDYRPRGWSAFSPQGYWVWGATDTPVVTLGQDDSATEIRVSGDPVRISAEMANALEDQVEILGGREIEFVGPIDITHKPFYHSVAIGKDGTLWMRRHVESVLEAGEWREPVARFDVFSPEGEALGSFESAANSSLRWANGLCAAMVETDALGVASVVILGASPAPDSCWSASGVN